MHGWLMAVNSLRGKKDFSVQIQHKKLLLCVHELTALLQIRMSSRASSHLLSAIALEEKAWLSWDNNSSSVKIINPTIESTWYCPWKTVKIFISKGICYLFCLLLKHLHLRSPCQHSYKYTWGLVFTELIQQDEAVTVTASSTWVGQRLGSHYEQFSRELMLNCV